MPFGLEGLGSFALLCVTSLFAITNPLSAAPVYLALTEGYTPAHRRQTLRTAVLTGLTVLVVFTLLGGTIFQIFGVTMDAFRIAGGLIVFAIGMDMLQAKRSRVKTTEEEERQAMLQDEVGITPLGIPMIAGPGAITTVMVLMTEARTIGHVAILLVSIGVVLGSIYAALRSGEQLVGRFGQTGLNVMTRLMGLLVAVIGVQFVIDGLRPILVGVMRAAGAG
jgi:multiple antibiotic resistance protein